jgi:hypothetical protein
MKQRIKIVAVVTGVFAACGFLICWILLGYSAYAYARHQMPNTRVLLALCPPSIVSLGLDSASLPVAVLGWLIIGFFNAITYSVPGFFVGIVVATVYPKGQSTTSRA